MNKPTTTVFKSTASTFLKTKAVPSTELDSHQKKGVRKDTILTVDAVQDLGNGHYRVTIISGGEGITEKDYVIYSPHWGIVETDDPNLTDEQPKCSVDSPAVQRQINRISGYLVKGRELNLDTKTTYYSQRDNHTMPHRTCNSSSNAMYLDWLLQVTKGKRLGGDDGYLKKVLSHDDTIYHHAQTDAIRDYGYNTKWMTDGDYPFVEDLLENSFPVVVNILHRGSNCAPRGGHIILLIGKDKENFVTHDPYGTLGSNYKKTNGAFARIPEDEFKIRWQGGYRILA